MEYYFLINPVAGRSDVSTDLIPLIEAETHNKGIPAQQVHITVTEYRGHAMELARKAAADGAPVRIYAVGGDGTFNEALCGAMGCWNAAVGCLPYGSGNDFLRSFGQREEFLDLPNQLAGGPKKIDMIRTQRGYAASICSAGMDARVAYGIPAFRRLPFCGGEMAYKLSLLQQLVGKRDQELCFTIDGRQFEEDCLMVAVCNGHSYGGGFLAAPEALLDDGILDVLVVRNLPLHRILRVVPLYKEGKHFSDGQILPELQNIIRYYPAHSVEIRPKNPDETMIVNVDGECGPDKRLSAEIEPLAAQILLPASVLARTAAVKK